MPTLIAASIIANAIMVVGNSGMEAVGFVLWLDVTGEVVEVGDTPAIDVDAGEVVGVFELKGIWVGEAVTVGEVGVVVG